MSMTAHLLGLLMVVMVAVACYQKPDCPTKICLQPPGTGVNCGVPSKKFSFDRVARKCKQYDYGGCGGGRNLFDTLKMCQKACPEMTPVCPSKKYHAVGDTCYFHSNETTTYEKAMTRCKEEENGYLVKLDDEDEKEKFQEHIREEVGEGLSRTCHKTMDVVFLIDTSDSLGRHGLKKELDFIKRFVRNFDFGPGEYQSQFAIVDTAGLSARRIKVRIYLKDYNNVDDFINALTEDWLTNQGALPWRAFEVTRTDVLLAEKGARANAKTILIMISDGVPERIEELQIQATQIKAQGVEVFDLLVNFRPRNLEAFKHVVSEPMEEHMFLMGTSDEITNKISTIVTEICWDKVEMWIGTTGKWMPTPTHGVMKTMNAAFSAELRPKPEDHQIVCETDKVYLTEEEQKRQ